MERDAAVSPPPQRDAVALTDLHAPPVLRQAADPQGGGRDVEVDGVDAVTRNPQVLADGGNRVAERRDVISVHHARAEGKEAAPEGGARDDVEIHAHREGLPSGAA